LATQAGWGISLCSEIFLAQDRKSKFMTQVGDDKAIREIVAFARAKFVEACAVAASKPDRHFLFSESTPCAIGELMVVWKNHHDQSGGIWEFMRPRLQGPKRQNQNYKCCVLIPLARAVPVEQDYCGGPVICLNSLNFTWFGELP
jgi:hypothetical protein